VTDSADGFSGRVFSSGSSSVLLTGEFLPVRRFKSFALLSLVGVSVTVCFYLIPDVRDVKRQILFSHRQKMVSFFPLPPMAPGRPGNNGRGRTEPGLTVAFAAVAKEKPSAMISLPSPV
jgi:hypothetical protein